MHPKSATVSPKSTTAYVDPLARQARCHRIAAVSRAHLVSAIDALDTPDLSVACRAGTMPVRRAAADVLHVRQPDGPTQTERHECLNCRRDAQPGKSFCEFCEWAIDEAAILSRRGWDVAAIVEYQNDCYSRVVA